MNLDFARLEPNRVAELYWDQKKRLVLDRKRAEMYKSAFTRFPVEYQLFAENFFKKFICGEVPYEYKWRFVEVHKNRNSELNVNMNVFIFLVHNGVDFSLAARYTCFPYNELRFHYHHAVDHGYFSYDCSLGVMTDIQYESEWDRKKLLKLQQKRKYVQSDIRSFLNVKSGNVLKYHCSNIVKFSG